MILRAYKVQLDVNNKQQTLLSQHNWELAKKKESFDKKEKIPNAIELHRELNKLKQSDVSWMYNSSKTSPQNALRDCYKAFQNFFTRCKKKVKGLPHGGLQRRLTQRQRIYNKLNKLIS